MSLPREVLDGLRAQFEHQGAARQVLALSDVEEIEGGWESPIFSFRVLFEEQGRRAARAFVLRSYAGPDGAERARQDFEIMTRVNHYGLPTPGLEFVLEAPAQQGAYLVMEKIEGRQALELLRSGAGDGELLARLAGYQAGLHVIPPGKIWPAQLDAEMDDPQGYASRRVARLRAAVEAQKLEGFAAHLDWLEARAAGILEARLALLHNDYHPENVLLRAEDGAAFIIDWSFAEVGERRMDLAWTLLQVGTMLGADARAEYLAAYEAAAGSPVKHLDFFEVLKFSERMATIAAWLRPEVQIPVAKISKAALRGSYKVHVHSVYAR